MHAIRRGLTVFCCGFLLVACQEDGAEASSGAEPIPDFLATAQKQCERGGGRWGLSPGKATYVCFQSLSDSGKLCSGEDDCKGLCLARSRTCSPIEPFYGCHEVLSNGGIRQTLCIQ